MSEVSPAPKIAVNGNFKSVTVTKKVKKGKVEAGLEGAAQALTPFTACSDPKVKVREVVVEKEVVKEVKVEVCSEKDAGILGSVKQGEKARIVLSLPEEFKLKREDLVIYFQHEEKQSSTLTYGDVEIKNDTLIFDVKAGQSEQVGEVSIVVKFISWGKQVVSLRGTLKIEKGAVKAQSKKKAGKQGGLEILSITLEEDKKPVLKSKKEL